MRHGVDAGPARVAPGDARRPASESVPVTTKPWQLAGDLPPGSGGGELGALTHGPPQVAEQARLDQSVQHRERGLVTVLGLGNRRAQRQIVGRRALRVPSHSHDPSPHWPSNAPESSARHTGLPNNRWPLHTTGTRKHARARVPARGWAPGPPCRSLPPVCDQATPGHVR